MKTVMKKMLSLLLTACMLMSAFVIGSYAADTSVSSFAELEAALAGAAPGDTVTLADNITATGTISIAGDVTIDGGGYSVMRSDAYAGSIFQAAGTLTLKNITLNGNRTSTKLEDLAAELIYMEESSVVNLATGAVLTVNRVDATVHAGGVWMAGGTLNMYDGAEISNVHQHNTSSAAPIYGTAVNIISGTFNMYGGKIEGCDGRVGAVGNIGGVFNMKGGVISGNIANQTGEGGGAVYNAGEFNMYGGTISNNVSWTRGGGVYNSGIFNLYDGTFTGNTVKLENSTTCEGAAICTVGTFNMEGGTITGNTAQNCGGGVQVNGGRASMSGGVISNNSTEAYSGGGVFVGNTAVFEMSGGVITENTAAQYGGAVAITSSAPSAVKITGGEIYGNRCGDMQCGADIYVTTATSSAMTQFGEGCVLYKLYIDNADSRYSASNAFLAPSSSLTSGYGYIYVSNGASHSFSDWEITLEPACVTSGVKQRTCTVCGVVEESTVPPKGHNTIAKRVEPTCSSEGSVTLYCPVCGYVHTTTVLPQTGHVSGSWTILKPAAENTDGEKVKRCIYCGEIIERAAYSYGDAAIYLTVGEPTEKTSSVNTMTVSVNIRNNPGIWSTGFYVYYSPDIRVSSAACGDVLNSEYFTCEAKNIEVSSDERAKELFKNAGIPCENMLYTCVYAESSTLDNMTSDGVLCTLDFEYSAELEGAYAIGFVYDEDNIINSDGENVSLIFENSTVAIEPLVKCNHVAGGWITVSPTCTVDGYRTKSCTLCGRELEREILEAPGHQAGEWIVTVEPGFAPGERVKKCVNCGAVVETETIKPIYAPEIAIDSVNVSAGAVADVNITVNYNPGIWGVRFFVYYPEEIQLKSVANGVVFGNDSFPNLSNFNISPAEITSLKEMFDLNGVDTDGIRAYCVYFENAEIQNTAESGTLITLSFAIPANASGAYKIGFVVDDAINTDGDSVNFNYKEGIVTVGGCSHEECKWVVVTPETCTDDGLRNLVCSACGEVVSSEVISAHGHTFSEEYTIDVEATRTEPGIRSRHCINCDAVTDSEEYYIVLPGDVTGDGRVNLRDLKAMKMLSAGESVDVVEWNSDINEDGRINIKDFAALKVLLSGN